MFFLFVFAVIVITADFVSGLIMDRLNAAQTDPAEKETLTQRFLKAAGISIAMLLVAFFFSGVDGIFEWHANDAIPFLVLASVAGAIVNALPFQSLGRNHEGQLTGNTRNHPTPKALNLAEVIRTTILGSMLRQLIMAILSIVFLASVIVLGLLIGASTS